MRTVIEIVRAELVRLGADGLVCPPAECACKLDDLVPCCGEISVCQPGWLVPSADPDDPHDWKMFTSRELAEKEKEARNAK